MGDIITIGLPQVGETVSIDELKIAKQSLLSLTLQPKEANFIGPTQKGAFRIFSLAPPKNPKDAPKPMKVYFEPLQIQETFTNEMTEHFLSQILKTSERMGQIFQSLGGVGDNQFKNMKEKLTNAVKSIPLVGGSLVNSGILKNAGDAVSAVLQGQRFDFPKMWQDSRAELTHEITTRLWCNNPNSDSEFIKNIIKPLEELLKYVLPRMSGTDHYKWPYFCSASAPGLFELPEAVIASISVNKGMGVNFGINNRPNVVEINIQMANIRNVMVNDSGGSSLMPYKLSSYLNNLKDKRDVPKVSNLKVSKNRKAIKYPRTTIPTENVSDRQRNTYADLKDAYPTIG